MHQLGTELGRFVGGSINGTQLRAVFSDYLASNPEQSLMVAGWLKQSVETGRLSASVWVLLHDLFEETPSVPAQGPGATTRVVDQPLRRASDAPPAVVDEELTRRQTDPPQVATMRHAARPPPAQTSGPLRTGMVVRERFVLMEELGSGGMGKVFKQVQDAQAKAARESRPPKRATKDPGRG